MFYQPTRALGLLVGSVLVLWTLVVTLILVRAAGDAAFGPGALAAYLAAAAAIAIACLLAFWTYALATLAYALDRNGLVITWGATRQVIPLESIERLVPATSAGVPRVRGLRWWGYHVGRAEVPQLGSVLCYSTHQSAAELLYVLTTDGAYAISVADPAAFAREIQVRQELGPIVPVARHVERTAAAALPFWHDPLARRLAGAATVVALASAVLVAVRYSGLPPTVAVQFPAWQPDPVVTVSSRETLIEIPRAALLLLVANIAGGAALLSWDRAAGYLALGAGGLVQVAMFVAAAIALF